MGWAERYPPSRRPTMEEIDAYADSALWQALRQYVRETYAVPPRVEYSRCGLEPGWNVKYKKGNRALCTVYLRPGYVTCMISIGAKDEAAAEAVLLACTVYTRELYQATASSRMGRWLMIDVTEAEILEDVKALLTVRARPQKK